MQNEECRLQGPLPCDGLGGGWRAWRVGGLASKTSISLAAPFRRNSSEISMLGTRSGGDVIRRGGGKSRAARSWNLLAFFPTFSDKGG